MMGSKTTVSRQCICWPKNNDKKLRWLLSANEFASRRSLKKDSKLKNGNTEETSFSKKKGNKWKSKIKKKGMNRRKKKRKKLKMMLFHTHFMDIVRLSLLMILKRSLTSIQTMQWQKQVSIFQNCINLILQLSHGYKAWKRLKFQKSFKINIELHPSIQKQRRKMSISPSDHAGIQNLTASLCIALYFNFSAISLKRMFCSLKRCQ